MTNSALSPKQLRAREMKADLALLARVLEGENQAWRELIARYRGLIFRCIHKAIGKFDSVLPSEAPEEIFSEVCFNLLRNDMRKLRLYDPERGSKVGSWIGLISINSAYDHLRSCARQPALDQIDGVPDRVDQAPGPLDNLLAQERRNHLDEMTCDFSARDRRFVDLYFRHGMSAKEVAQQMDISVKTVYSKKNKIRKRLLAMSSQTAMAA
ncbi:MAG: sigma-70 family RNA polymerase sigma factor [Deltaproteobacteria bacterium]|nr:sigma-70 family RNA polymerase sigma factor [Deltaproteobacteria bacterium]